MHITREQLEELIAHARLEKPKEACGILAGKNGKVAAVYRGTNVDQNPNIRYMMDPIEQYRVLRQIDDDGLEVVGLYHSHPQSAAFPSATDKKLAFFPDAVYVIVSLMDDERPIVRGYNIVEDRVTEVDLLVE